jgi:broad specificity phosphatase PhoE
MAYFILIRHSLSLPDPSMPANQWELTQEGIRRCSILAQALKPYDVHKIYTSEEPKACSTGEYVGENLGIDYEIAPNFHETQAVTAPFFKDPDEFRARVKEAMLNPDDVIYGEESFNHAYARFENQMRVLSFHYPKKTLAIVTHGRVMSMYIGKTCGLKPYDVWQQLDLPAYAVIQRSDMQLVKLIPSLNHADEKANDA